MGSAGESLRLVVEHWLAPDPTTRVQVTHFRNRRSRRECYVCVEAIRADGPVAMFFFRHEDGLWRIFPPRRERPAMRAPYISTSL
jgi:hypothetical protein